MVRCLTRIVAASVVLSSLTMTACGGAPKPPVAPVDEPAIDVARPVTAELRGDLELHAFPRRMRGPLSSSALLKLHELDPMTAMRKTRGLFLPREHVEAWIGSVVDDAREVRIALSSGDEGVSVAYDVGPSAAALLEQPPQTEDSAYELPRPGQLAPFTPPVRPGELSALPMFHGRGVYLRVGSAAMWGMASKRSMTALEGAMREPPTDSPRLAEWRLTGALLAQRAEGWLDRADSFLEGFGAHGAPAGPNGEPMMATPTAAYRNEITGTLRPREIVGVLEQDQTFRVRIDFVTTPRVPKWVARKMPGWGFGGSMKYEPRTDAAAVLCWLVYYWPHLGSHAECRLVGTSLVISGKLDWQSELP